MATIQERLGGIEARLEGLCRDVKRVMLFLVGNGDPGGGMVGEVSRLREARHRRKKLVLALHVAALAVLGGYLTNRWTAHVPPLIEQTMAQEQTVIP